MSRFSRFLIRLRRQFLRCYEVSMSALLIAVAVAALLPTTRADAGSREEAQCGKIQSSATVMHR